MEHSGRERLGWAGATPDQIREKETSLLLSGGLQLSLTLGSRDEMRAVLKAYSSGWRALTAHEALLCQDIINRLAQEIWRRAGDDGSPLPPEQGPER
jgi:hypothetical protein